MEGGVGKRKKKVDTEASNQHDQQEHEREGGDGISGPFMNSGSSVPKVLCCLPQLVPGPVQRWEFGRWEAGVVGVGEPHDRGALTVDDRGTGGWLLGGRGSDLG